MGDLPLLSRAGGLFPRSYNTTLCPDCQYFFEKNFFEKTLDNVPGLCYNTDRKKEGANKMYQIIKNGKVEKWVAVKGGKLIEVDAFNSYSEAHNARERMEEVHGGFFEIVEKKS